MKVSLLKRNIPKGPALAVIALVAAASVVTGRERPALEIVETRQASATASSSASAAPPAAAVLEIDLERLARREAAASVSDAFAARSFAPPAPPPAPAAPAAQAAAPAPAAPPLPFRYFGRLTAAGKTDFYVMRGEDLIQVAPGMKIDDYRVDAVSESAIRFTYLPLRTSQSLSLQEGNG